LTYQLSREVESGATCIPDEHTEVRSREGPVTRTRAANRDGHVGGITGEIASFEGARVRG
jgi:hypothetical protein